MCETRSMIGSKLLKKKPLQITLILMGRKKDHFDSVRSKHASTVPGFLYV